MPIKQISLFEFLLLTAVVTVLTVSTAWVYPIWDDARLLVLIGESGDAAIRGDLDSRVLLSHFFIFLSHRGLFLPVGLVLHWMSWFGMGLVTLRFWQMTFPAHARFALLPAILSVTPILCKVQFVVMSVVFIDVIEPVLAFCGILLLMSERWRGRRRILVTAGSLFLIVVACLLSEYGVATAAVGCVLLFGKALRTAGAGKRESMILALLVSACPFVSYIVFSILAASAASPPYQASFAILSLFGNIQLIPFRLISGIWRGVIGAYLESLGSITVYGKAPLLSFFSGAILSAMVTFAVYRRRADASPAGRDWPTALTLLVATVIGVLPFLLMNRTLETYWDSRFWLPAMPLVSSLTVYLLLSVVRKRLWILVPICCGFLAGYWTTTEIIRTHKNQVPPFSILAIPKK